MGSANTDHTLTVEFLPQPGATVLATHMQSSPGGKGSNQAIAAARAGACTEFVGAIGNDSRGADLRSHLIAHGIGLRGLTELCEPSGLATIMVDKQGNNMIVVAPGANGQLTLDPPAKAVIADCEILLVQLEIPLDTAIHAAQEAHNAGATVMVNASPVSTDTARLHTLAALTDIVIVNTTEAAQWCWETKHTVITRGAHGVRYQGLDGHYDIPAPHVEVRDTTGAGDVFAGVLAAEWASDVHRALMRACVAGSLATTISGAGDCAPSAAAIDHMITLLAD